MSKYLYFDGESTYVDVENFPSPSNNGRPITIEFWNYVKSSDVQNSYPFSFQVSGDEGQDKSRTSCHAPWGNKRIYWDCGAWDDGGRVEGDYSSYLDKWTHIALVSSGTMEGNKPIDPSKQFQAIYLNGELFQSKNSAKAPSHIFRQLLIGADYENNDRFQGVVLHHKGWITNFRVWNDVRSAAEIKCNLYTRMTGKEHGLIASYDFEYDGSLPTSLPNKVANKPAGTLHNFSASGIQPPSGLPTRVIVTFTEIDDEVTVKLGDETIFEHGLLRKTEDPICKDITGYLQNGANNIAVTLNNNQGQSKLYGVIATQDKTTQVDFDGIAPRPDQRTATKTYTITK